MHHFSTTSCRLPHTWVQVRRLGRPRNPPRMNTAQPCGACAMLMMLLIHLMASSSTQAPNTGFSGYFKMFWGWLYVNDHAGCAGRYGGDSTLERNTPLYISPA